MNPDNILEAYEDAKEVLGVLSERDMHQSLSTLLVAMSMLILQLPEETHQIVPTEMFRCLKKFLSDKDVKKLAKNNRSE